MFRSFARWCHQHPWTVIGAWLAAIVAAMTLAGVVGPSYDSSFSSPESESSDGFETISEYFPGATSQFGGQLVFQAEQGIADPAVRSEIEEILVEVAEIDGVTVISPFSEQGAAQIAPDGTIAYAQLNLSDDVDQTESGEIGEELNEIVADTGDLRVEIGGAMFAEFEPPETELIGLAFAIIVLIVSFGSVLAMGLPIGVALSGVIVGSAGLVTLLTKAFTIPDFAPLIGIMIGLGAGIDYALFIVTRYRELTHAGVEPKTAIEAAMDTAGRAVVFAGITVVVSLLGMLLIGLPFVAGMGMSAAATVFVTLISSVTLLPALLSLTHSRIEVTRWRGLIAAGFVALGLLGAGLGNPTLFLFGAGLAIVTLIAGSFVPALKKMVPERKRKPLRDTLAYKWSRGIQHRPWIALIGGTAILVLLTLPVFGMRLGFSDEGNFAEDTTTRQAYDLVAEGFGDGYNGPFVLAIETDSPDDVAVVQELAAAAEATEGVAAVGQPFPNNFQDPAASEAFIIQIIPEGAPQDADTEDTVLALREAFEPIVEGTGVEANLTGAVPASIDFSDYLSGRNIIFFGAVLIVSFFLLMMVFRSILVPIKAVIMNVLSITAAFGVVVAIFQQGWLGIEGGPIEPFIPMMMFAIVFGLSMDYEVFLLSRVKEEYDRTGDPRNSVADGLAATARVITAAAAIMVVVFGAFLLEDDRIIRLFGTGLALAVLLDATLVRMLLVPATMELLGNRNWWLPRWIDKILPRLNVEGAHLEELLAESGVDVEVPDTPEDLVEPVR
ncbi:RND superfamily putative drug exporter [Ilumatobacter fluminis]|uniref:RND superfamily putative drug exporter n=2 Tax=Ilumatobacter fluminis TaxID=467091 RepID=A0A4R7I4C2_9ACTN|nr:RND superfamily putative drug exporter [Ilumatobacter fluminis]